MRSTICVLSLILMLGLLQHNVHAADHWFDSFGSELQYNVHSTGEVSSFVRHVSGTGHITELRFRGTPHERLVSLDEDDNLASVICTEDQLVLTVLDPAEAASAYGVGSMLAGSARWNCTGNNGIAKPIYREVVGSDVQANGRIMIFDTVNRTLTHMFEHLNATFLTNNPEILGSQKLSEDGETASNATANAHSSASTMFWGDLVDDVISSAKHFVHKVEHAAEEVVDDVESAVKDLLNHPYHLDKRGTAHLINWHRTNEELFHNDEATVTCTDCHLRASVTLGLDISISLSRLHRFEVSATLATDMAIITRAHVHDRVSRTYNKRLLNVHVPATLNFMLGPVPLHITFSIPVSVSAHLTAHGSLTAEAGFSFSRQVQTGWKYPIHSDAGFFMTASPSRVRVYDSLSQSGEASMTISIHPSITAEIDALIDLSVGPVPSATVTTEDNHGSFSCSVGRRVDLSASASLNEDLFGSLADHRLSKTFNWIRSQSESCSDAADSFSVGQSSDLVLSASGNDTACVSPHVCYDCRTEGSECPEECSSGDNLCQTFNTVHHCPVGHCGVAEGLQTCGYLNGQTRCGASDPVRAGELDSNIEMQLAAYARRGSQCVEAMRPFLCENTFPLCDTVTGESTGTCFDTCVKSQLVCSNSRYYSWNGTEYIDRSRSLAIQQCAMLSSLPGSIVDSKFTQTDSPPTELGEELERELSCDSGVNTMAIGTDNEARATESTYECEIAENLKTCQLLNGYSVAVDTSLFGSAHAVDIYLTRQIDAAVVMESFLENSTCRLGVESALCAMYMPPCHNDTEPVPLCFDACTSIAGACATNITNDEWYQRNVSAFCSSLPWVANEETSKCSGLSAWMPELYATQRAYARVAVDSGVPKVASDDDDWGSPMNIVLLSIAGIAVVVAVVAVLCTVYGTHIIPESIRVRQRSAGPPIVSTVVNPLGPAV